MFEHKTVSLADQVFERIENDILSGKYPRGSVLTELGLSQELGVSRTPVREALRMLSAEHLIEEKSKGAVVIGITEEELRELSETVELQEFYTEKKDAERIRAMDSKFHELFYRAGKSVIFYNALMPLHKKAQRYRKMSVQNKKRAESSLMEHRVIYEAIKNKNGEAAKTAAEQHVKNAAYHILMGDK